VNNNKHKIASGQKAYNPDGSVNYVCLDLEWFYEWYQM
jgi:hypothetical protein